MLHKHTLFKAASILALSVACAAYLSSVDASADQMQEVHPEIWPKLTSPIQYDQAIEDQISAIMAKMSVEDKVGQTIQGELRHLTPEDVRKYRLGSVLNGGGSQPYGKKIATPEDWLRLADEFYDASMDTSGGGIAIPILWGTDAVHGHNNVKGATIFPHNIGLGAARNPDLIRQIGHATAREVRVTGQEWSFAPTLAVVRDDRWGRTYESYSEDPQVVADYAKAMVAGIQGAANTDNFLTGDHVIASAKHFLGDGGTDGGKDQGDNIDNEKTLRDIHAAGYVTALDAGVQTVMASFSGWNGRKMHGRKMLLTDVLKGQMGFDGFIVGDWNGHGQVKGCTNENCPQTYNAGLDMVMVPEDWKALYENTVLQVKDGTIPMARLDDAVRRILRVKIRAGLFTGGKPSNRALAAKTEVLGHADHRAIARQAVRESLVLLKNNDGLLPLKPNSKILVTGDGADNIGKQSGGWTLSWQGNDNQNSDFPGGTSIWDGIKEAATKNGSTAILSADGSFTEKPDVAIIVFGENPYAEFQGDRDYLSYGSSKNNEVELLREYQAAGIKTVAVFLSGRPLYTTPELNASDAFVAAWLPGSQGAGVGDIILSGQDGNPSHDFKGKLSFSWPERADQGPLNVGDENYAPLFAYGYGLSYTDNGNLPELEEFAVPETANSDYFFNDGVVSPYKLFVTAEPAWSLEIANNGGELKVAEQIKVELTDRNVQEDARRISFSGASQAAAMLKIFDTLDLSRETNGDMQLGMTIRVDTKPEGSVYLGMGCGDQCFGGVDIAERLSSYAIGEWVNLNVPLKCFRTAGADMEKLETLWRVGTDKPFAFTINKVGLVPPQADLSCPPAIKNIEGIRQD